MANLKIAASPLTGVIYAGNTIKNNTMWGKNKQDVTIDALVAVCEHVLKFGTTVQIMTPDGVVDFEIDVKTKEGIDTRANSKQDK